MNKAKLTNLCHKISSNTGLSFNSVLTYFFLEQILIKISDSVYHHNFIFKGGYILSNIVGINARTTIDIDMLLNNITLERTLLGEIFDEIFIANETDSVKFNLVDIQEIKSSDEYGGYRVRVLCKLDNINQVIPLDIATGDIVTYFPEKYEYKMLFSDGNLKILAYNIETMLAEKLETIYSKGILNSRSKDFYDIHLLLKLKLEFIDFKKLRIACEKTFGKRNTTLDFNHFKRLIIIMNQDESFIIRWNSYVKKNQYVEETSFAEVVKSLTLIIEKLEVI